MNGYHVMPRIASSWPTGLVPTMVYEAHILPSRPTVRLMAQSSNGQCGRGLDRPHDRCREIGRLVGRSFIVIALTATELRLVSSIVHSPTRTKSPYPSNIHFYLGKISMAIAATQRWPTC